MNKKTVLFLINGFGIEKKESYPIYDETLMPTFEELSKKYIFSTNSVTSNVTNYYDAYRNISLDVGELYNYSILDQEINNKKINFNENLNKIKNELEVKKNNMHFFCLVDTSPKIVSHLKEFLKLLNPNHDKRITLHLVISSNDINDYNKLISIFSDINMELSNYASIGFILGLSSIDNNAKQVDLNFFFRMFISKIGEKWQSFTQRFDILRGTNVLPRDTKPFLVNTNFNLNKDDIFFFFNYDTINLVNFVDTMSNINFGEEPNNFSYYSLFTVNSNKNITSLYNSTVSYNSLVKNLEFLDARSLIVCQKEKIGVINYFCNGLKNEVNERLSFVDIDPYYNNPESIVNVINNFSSDLIIINYEFDDVESTVLLKQRLGLIDRALKAVYDNSMGSKYTIIVSSLYGMSKVMLNEKENPCHVIFSNKLPFIYIDDFITKKNYLVETGTINDILKTSYKTIKKDSNYYSLVEKKNILYKLFFN